MPVSAENNSGQMAGGNERILFIDDEEMLVQTGKEIIGDLGYTVTAFKNCNEALETFRNNPMAFDAVITDYTMPHMTGYDLAGRIREIRQDIPVIICSGFMQGEVENKINNAGINAFIKKPFNKSEIAQVLRRTLDSLSGE